jgi:polysaccharide export outer membrane protein
MKSLSERILVVVGFGITCLFFLPGCSSTQAPAHETSSGANPANLASRGLTAAGANRDLEVLWSARRANPKDFAVGPGDVLEIKVPSVKELEDQTVRVDGKGDIDLPLLGSMHVAGLSESELDSALVKKLGDYLYHPQAEIFVKSYNNREVSVTGEVRSPAAYTLNGPEDTVRELIQRAGGITQQASPEIVLTPAAGSIDQEIVPSAEAKGTGYSTASYNPGSEGSGADSPESSEASSSVGHPLIIDLSRNSHQGRYLDLPLRPGDTIFVPGAGTVSTVGWVQHPLTMPITHDLSVIGAVAASGGTLFAANEHDVKIVRRQTDGQIAVMNVDIASIQAGKSADVPLRDGDIVDVGYSAVKIPGYALYYAAQGLVSYAPAALLVSGF